MISFKAPLSQNFLGGSLESKPFESQGVTCVRLSHFRSYKALTLRCDTRPVVLTGHNGAGKTNLLEALSFFSVGRGLRGARLSEICHGFSYPSPHPWYVSIDLCHQGETVTLGTGYEGGARGGAALSKGAWGEAEGLWGGAEDPWEDAKGPRGEPKAGKERRLLYIQGEKNQPQTRLNRYISLIWLTPSMDGIFQGPASHRRKFLDRLVCSFDPEHTARLHRYAYALRERAVLLKRGHYDAQWLGTLEETMASAGVALAYARQDAVALLSQASAWSLGIFPQAHLKVVGILEDWMNQGLSALDVEDRLRESLKRSRLHDAEKGSAAQGPHRTDLLAFDEKRGVQAWTCSTGEQKAFLLSLIMAAIRVQSSHENGVPMVLLDEVIAHLDTGRRYTLFEEIKNLKMQVWMTGTDFHAFEALQDGAQYFMVSHSQIKPQDF